MLRFSKPKTPGFGIAESFYLSVLSSHAVLPSMLAIVNPGGENGAVPGFGVPLAKGVGKDVLSAPLERGAYAVASKDRKTVLSLKVLSKEEAGFDPEAFVLSELAKDATPELLARLRATWTLAQFSFESHDPKVFPALQFLLSLCVRMATLTEGVIADPISQRYMLPEDAYHPGLEARDFDPADLVSFVETKVDQGYAVFTLGLQKLALQELEIILLDSSAGPKAGRFLLGLCQGILNGRVLKLGDQVGSPKAPFQVVTGGLDRARWEGIACFELVPPTGWTPEAALDAWLESA